MSLAWKQAIDDADFDALDCMAECLVLFCGMRARYRDAEDFFQHAVETLTSAGDDNLHPAANRLRIRWVRAWLLPERKPIPEAIRTQLAQSFEMAQEHDDQDTVAWCLWVQAEFERISRAYETALGFYEQALARFHHLGNPHAVGRVLRGIAFCSRVY